VSQETQQTISQWCEDTFGPAQSNARLADRAQEEMNELHAELAVDDKHPRSPFEIADVFICLYRVATLLGVDIHQVIDEKMAINRARQWQRDGTGCGYHIKPKE
jgi:hypothetical protein